MAESWKDFLAGTVGGFAGKLVDYPFDTIKVLLQTQNVGPAVSTSAPATVKANAKAPPLYRGAWHCFTYTLQTKGFFGLYKGLSSPLLGSMAENAVLFLAYGNFKKLLGETEDNDLSLFQLALAGAGAGTVVPFVLTPVELVKCRLQVQQSMSSEFRAYKGPIDCIVKTVQQEGIAAGLYKGHASTLLREIPGNFFWYGTYESVCMAMVPEGGTKADLGASAHLLGGAAAGVAYWTAFYPADTVKSHVQTNPNFARSSFWTTLKGVYASEGVAGLYRGWGITALRAAPAHALIFACYEETMKWL
eukprot:g1371.t1